MATQSTSSKQRAGPPGQSSSASSEYLVTPESTESPVISVVLPTLNEERGIEECIRRICNALEAVELPGEIVLSDSSTDRTPEIGREMGARVVTPDRPGYGYAYRYAFDRVEGEYVVMGDADTTYDFEELPKLLAPVMDGTADICMGSRLEGSIKPGAMPKLHQYVGNPMLTAFLNVFYDAGVSDAHSGFRVFHGGVVEDLDLTTDGMEFASEMIMAAGARDLEIAEVPITYHEREGEATLDSFRDGWRHVEFMLKNAPGYLFSVPGVMLLVAGFVVSGLALFDLQLANLTFGVHSLIGGSLLVLAGYQVAAMGAFATVACDPIKRPNDPITETIIDHLSLERGATLGLVVLAIGVAVAAYIVVSWGLRGFAGRPLPTIKLDIVAFLPIVLGLQTVFSSFYLSMLVDADQS